MSILEIVLLSLLGAGLLTYIIIGTIKTIKKRKNPNKENEEE